MKVLSPREWERLVAPQLLEVLPGEWIVDRGYLQRLEGPHVGWYLTRQVTRGRGFTLRADIQPQYIFTTVLNAGLGIELGRAQPGVRSYIPSEEATAETVPIAELQTLIERFALPHFDRYRTLADVVVATEEIAKSRESGRGTWWSESWAAGALTLLGDLSSAASHWHLCLRGLRDYDMDSFPELREVHDLAQLGLAAGVSGDGTQVTQVLLENERRMREQWKF